MENKPLSEATDLELKSLGFDTIQNIEMNQLALKTIRQELNNRASKNQEILQNKVTTSDTTGTE